LWCDGPQCKAFQRLCPGRIECSNHHSLCLECFTTGVWA
jgi:hypothetical protein